jgi:hypothetical protein
MAAGDGQCRRLSGSTVSRMAGDSWSNALAHLSALPHGVIVDLRSKF